MSSRAIVVGVLALAATGCGSSASMTRLRAAAAQVCTRAADQGAHIAPPAVPAAMPAFLRRGVAVLQPELADLRELQAPNEQAGTYSAAVGLVAHELTILTGTVHDLDRGADPLTAIKTLQHRLAPVEADDNAAWRTFGVPACVNR